MTHEAGFGGIHEAVDFLGDWASGLGYGLAGLSWMDGALPIVDAIAAGLIISGRAGRGVGAAMDSYDARALEQRMAGMEIKPFSFGSVPGVIFYE